jgi:hypothetical protein
MKPKPDLQKFFGSFFQKRTKSAQRQAAQVPPP